MRHKQYNSLIYYPLHEEFINHHRIFNKIIEDVAEENHILFIDNESVLNETKYFIDFVHYTTEGVKVLADNYANYLYGVDIFD